MPPAYHGSGYSGDRGTFPDRGDPSSRPHERDRDPRDRDSWYSERPGGHGGHGGYPDRPHNAGWRNPNKPGPGPGHGPALSRNRSENWPSTGGAGFDRERDQKDPFKPYEDSKPNAPHLVRQRSAPEYLTHPAAAQHGQPAFPPRSPPFRSASQSSGSEQPVHHAKPSAPRGPRVTDGFKPPQDGIGKVSNLPKSTPATTDSTTTSANKTTVVVKTESEVAVKGSNASDSTMAAKALPAPLIRIVSDGPDGSNAGKPSSTVKPVTATAPSSVSATTSTSAAAAAPVKSTSSIFDLVGGFNLIKDKKGDSQKDATGVDNSDGDDDDEEIESGKKVPTSGFSLRQVSASTEGDGMDTDDMEQSESVSTARGLSLASAWGQGLSPRATAAPETPNPTATEPSSAQSTVQQTETKDHTSATNEPTPETPLANTSIVETTISGAEKFKMELKASVAAIKRANSAPLPTPAHPSAAALASMQRDLLNKKRAAESQLTKGVNKVPSKPSTPVPKRIVESDTDENDEATEKNKVDETDGDLKDVTKLEASKKLTSTGSKSPAKSPVRVAKSPSKEPRVGEDEAEGAVSLKRKPSTDDADVLDNKGANDVSGAGPRADSSGSVLPKKKPGPKQRARDREQLLLQQAGGGAASTLPSALSSKPKPRVAHEGKPSINNDKTAQPGSNIVSGSHTRPPKMGPPIPTVAAKYRSPLPKVTLNKVNKWIIIIAPI